MTKYFFEIDVKHIEGVVILLDVDGTIATDSSSDLAQKTINNIQVLAQKNNLYFCSNKKNSERDLEITRKTGIHFINSQYKKPNKKVISNLNIGPNQKILVIGDKFLTDGLLAYNIGSKFIKVKNIQSKNKALVVHFFYYLDNILHQVFLYKTGNYFVKFYIFLRLLIFPTDWFSDLMNDLNGEVLSLGCGYGILESVLAIHHPNLIFMASDFSPKRIMTAANATKDIPNISFMLEDAIRFQDNKKYNNVLLIDLLHHLPDGEQLILLDKIWEVVLPGGIIMIKDVDTKPKWKYLWNYLHDYLMAGFPLTYYDSDFYIKYFKRKGALVSFYTPTQFHSPYNHYVIKVLKLV